MTGLPYTEVMDVHPAIEPIAFLLGRWSGPGRGFYPTIKDFTYTETLTFATIPGKPFLTYHQATTSPEGRPMHTEVGFFRPVGDGAIEVVLALPTGQTELLEGTVSPGEITLENSRVVNTSSAKHVDATRRSYRLAGTTLHTEFGMAAVGQPMTGHLVSDLTRVAE